MTGLPIPSLHRRSPSLGGDVVLVFLMAAAMAVVHPLAVLGQTPDRPEQCSLDLEQVYSTTGPGDSLLAYVSMIAVSPHGQVHVMDENPPRVFVYGESGQLIRRFGGEGDGPGEFRFAKAMGFLADTLWVSDAIRWRTTLFDASGTAVATIPVGGVVSSGVVPSALLGDGSALGSPPGVVTGTEKPDFATLRWPILELTREATSVHRFPYVPVPVSQSLREEIENEAVARIVENLRMPAAEARAIESNGRHRSSRWSRRNGPSRDNLTLNAILPLRARGDILRILQSVLHDVRYIQLVVRDPEDPPIPQNQRSEVCREVDPAQETTIRRNQVIMPGVTLSGLIPHEIYPAYEQLPVRGHEESVERRNLPVGVSEDGRKARVEKPAGPFAKPPPSGNPAALESRTPNLLEHVVRNRNGLYIHPYGASQHTFAAVDRHLIIHPMRQVDVAGSVHAMVDKAGKRGGDQPSRRQLDPVRHPIVGDDRFAQGATDWNQVTNLLRDRWTPCAACSLTDTETDNPTQVRGKNGVYRVAARLSARPHGVEEPTGEIEKVHTITIGNCDGVSRYGQVMRSLEVSGTLATTAPGAEEVARGREDAHVIVTAAQRKDLATWPNLDTDYLGELFSLIAVQRTPDPQFLHNRQLVFGTHRLRDPVLSGLVAGAIGGAGARGGEQRHIQLSCHTHLELRIWNQLVRMNRRQDSAPRFPWTVV